MAGASCKQSYAARIIPVGYATGSGGIISWCEVACAVVAVRSRAPSAWTASQSSRERSRRDRRRSGPDRRCRRGARQRGGARWLARSTTRYVRAQSRVPRHHAWRSARRRRAVRSELARAFSRTGFVARRGAAAARGALPRRRPGEVERAREAHEAQGAQRVGFDASARASRRRRAARSATPPSGSISSPPASDCAIALTVKSRSARSLSIARRATG